MTILRAVTLTTALLVLQSACRTPGGNAEVGDRGAEQKSDEKKPVVAGRMSAPYELLPPPADAASFHAILDGRTQAVWLDGDVLHFACIRTEGPIQLAGGVQEQLARIGDSDLWLARVKWSNWNQALVACTFFGPDMKPVAPLDVWRGEQAPPMPEYSEAPAQIETLEIDSPNLGEKRSVTIVLPPGVDHDVPAIVMADGQSAANWGKILRALIDSGHMRPTAIIGIHSGEYRGDRTREFDPQLDMRAREYLEPFDAERFAAHLRWVTDEVLPLAAEKYGISTRREDLAVAGFSNGGSFAAAAALRRPDVFGAALAFSVGVMPEGEKPVGPLPRFYFASGELEPSFLKTTRKTLDLVRGWGAEAELQSYCAGHDSLMWDIALARFAPMAFPPR